MDKARRRDLTTESMPLTLVRFALPFLLSYFLQTLYGMADLFIIGLYCGKEATAAVSVSSQVMHMYTVIAVGLSMGATVLIGRAVGAGNRDAASRAAGVSVTLFGCLAAVSAAALFCLAPVIVKGMSTPAEAAPGALVYLRICFAGVPFIVAYNLISAVFRGLGDSVRPMVFVAVACVANVILDFLLIGRAGMGPAGAALGTVVSQAVSVAVALVYIRVRDVGLRLSAKDLIPQKDVLRDILRIGLPVAVQDGFIQISFLVITVIANRRSLETAAAVGVTEKLICFFFLVPSALLSTVSAVAAQNIGARRYDRARHCLKYSVAAAVLFGFVCSVLTQFFAEGMISVFTRDAAVIEMGGQYLRGYIWDCMLAGVHFCFSGYFCAAGRSMLSFIHNAVSIVCARVPLAYRASVRFADTLFPMGLAPTVGSLLSVIICIIMYAALEKKHRGAALFSEQR